MRWLLLSLFLSISFIGLSQSGTIRGFVYDKNTGEPIIFTNVFLKGTQMGASTDVNGYYSISKIPPGAYTISVSALGFSDAAEEITVGKGAILNQKLFIESKVEELGVVEISADKIEAQTEVKMSVQKITPKEIEKLPSIGGEADIAQ